MFRFLPFSGKCQPLITQHAIPAVLGMLCFFAGCGSPHTPTSNETPSKVVLAEPNPLANYRGENSCAAAACHGSLAPSASGIGQNEFRLFHENGDPHTSAHLKLGNDLSQDIIRRLAGEKQEDPSTIRQIYEWCFRCHNTSTEDVPTTIVTTSKLHQHEGVSCEACHGPSESWISSHWQNPADDTLLVKSPELLESVFSRQSRRVDSKDLQTRAAICTRCHVGESAGDVNHDLIAAGHPLMQFEFSMYYRGWPKHWTRNDHPDEGNETLSWDLWLSGQKLTTLRSLKLLAARADRSRSEVPFPVGTWPELAEMDCVSCHHKLTGENRKVSAGNPIPSRLTTPWRIASRTLNNSFHEDLTRLRDKLKERWIPDQTAISGLARQAYSQLVDLPPDHWGSDIRKISKFAGHMTIQDAETATRLYLALQAAELSFGEDQPGRLERLHQFDSLKAALELREVYSSDRKVIRSSSLRDVETRRRIHKQFSELLNQLTPLIDSNP